MTLEDLRIFVSACEAGSLSALARGIGRTQSSVSQHVALVAADHPFARRSRVRLRDLREIRYLGLSEGTKHRDLMEQAASARGIELRPEVVFDDFDTASVFVELGLGQAIVPAVQAHGFARGGAVKAVRIVDLPPIPVGWGFRHWKHLSAVAKDFVRLVDLELRKMKRIPGLRLVRAEGSGPSPRERAARRV